MTLGEPGVSRTTKALARFTNLFMPAKPWLESVGREDRRRRLPTRRSTIECVLLSSGMRIQDRTLLWFNKRDTDVSPNY
jgi:hypothetical protein